MGARRGVGFRVQGSGFRPTPQTLNPTTLSRPLPSSLIFPAHDLQDVPYESRGWMGGSHWEDEGRGGDLRGREEEEAGCKSFKE